MTLKNRYRQNQTFQGRIREIEKELVEISLEIGKRRGQNPVITKIYAYLMIHGDLTQKELKRLTGYSIGSISTHLAALMSMNFIEKKLILGTHTNVYSLELDIFQNLSSLIEASKRYIKQTKNFLDLKKREMLQILEKKQKDFQSVINRFEELESVIELYAILFNFATNTDKDITFDFTPNESNDLIYPKHFEPEIQILEKEIIDFFTYSPIFFGKQEIFSKTFAYFITRKNLTQKKLRELTGLSAGKVSQEVNTLLEFGIIEIVNKSDRGEITYEMKSVISAFLKVSTNVLSEYMKWKEKIENMHNELVQRNEELEKLAGYEEVFNFINTFLEVLPFYEKLYYKISEIRKKIAKS
jgi:DNA-binding transcriptional regulator GbsR (MarR family)